MVSQCFKLGGSFSWRCQTGHDAAPREAPLWVPITDVSEGLMSAVAAALVNLLQPTVAAALMSLLLTSEIGTHRDASHGQATQ